MFSLYDLKIGEEGIVEEIVDERSVQERLHSLGIVHGVVIAPIKETPFRSPRVYKYLNTCVALRDSTAQKIKIKKNEKNN